MSHHLVRETNTLDDLPDLIDFIPELMSTGFPEDFEILHAEPHLRLLRSNLHGEAAALAFRHNDLRDLAAHPSVGMVTDHPYLKRFYGNLVFTTNPPIHGPLRQVLARPLSQKRIPCLHEVAKRLATDIVDEVTNNGVVDFCSEVSDRFTAGFWGTLFAMTPGDIDRIVEATRIITALACFETTSEEVARADASMDVFLDVVSDAIGKSVAKGDHELLEPMLSLFSEIESHNRPRRFEEMIAANVFDGIHTASLAVANSLYALLSSPDHLQAVREDPSLVPAAADEGMRLLPPLIYSRRCALSDIEFAGVTLPKGTEILMLLAAGNRDPEVFDQPNCFDFTRQQRNQTTFGGGVHICPGRHVVGMLIRVMLETVLQPGVEINIKDRPTWVRASEMRQLSGLRVSVRAAT